MIPISTMDQSRFMSFGADLTEQKLIDEYQAEREVWTRFGQGPMDMSTIHRLVVQQEARGQTLVAKAKAQAEAEAKAAAEARAKREAEEAKAAKEAAARESKADKKLQVA